MGSLAEMARELDMAEESSSEEEKVEQHKVKPVVDVQGREENKSVIQKDDALAEYEELLGGSIEAASPVEVASEGVQEAAPAAVVDAQEAAEQLEDMAQDLLDQDGDADQEASAVIDPILPAAEASEPVNQRATVLEEIEDIPDI